MIYDPDSKKFQSYCRCLSKAERVAAVYAAEIAKVENKRANAIQCEEQRWYANWEDAKAALYMDMLDARKNIEFNKWLRRNQAPVTKLVLMIKPYKALPGPFQKCLSKGLLKAFPLKGPFKCLLIKWPLKQAQNTFEGEKPPRTPTRNKHTKLAFYGPLSP